MFRKAILALLLAGCVALVAVTSGLAAKGGNAENAHLCQKDGWQGLVKADFTPFANERECVSYAARGGTLTTDTTQARCQSVGGTYEGEGRVFDGGSTTHVDVVLYGCSGWPVADADDYVAKHTLLTAPCVAAGGDLTSQSAPTANPGFYLCIDRRNL